MSIDLATFFGLVASFIVGTLMHRSVSLRERIHELESKLRKEDTDFLDAKLSELLGLDNMVSYTVSPPHSTVEAVEEEDQALHLHVVRKLRRELQESIGDVYRLSGRIIEKAYRLPTRRHWILFAAAPPLLLRLAGYLISEAPRRLPEMLLSIDAITAALLIALVILIIAIGWRSEDMREEICRLLKERAEKIHLALGYEEASSVPSFREFCSGARGSFQYEEPHPVSR